MKEKIYKDIVSCLKKLGYDYKSDFTVERPRIEAHGDFSSNVALKSAKANGINPREMAEKIVEFFQDSKDYEKVDLAGPGFINFAFSQSYYHSSLKKIVKEKANYGKSTHGNKRKVILEFVSANPTGPLNIVSARAAAYGDTLYRIMNFSGYDAFREFYVNDAGNQVDILAESLELRYREIYGDPIEEFPPDAYHGEYVKDLAQALSAIEGTKIFHMAEKDRLERMKNFALGEVHRWQVESLEKFGVQFDNWMSEKKLRAEGALEEALSYLAEAKCTYESEDAVWFCSSKFGDEKDRVLIKTDGNVTYFVPDIAYHITKYHRGFDIIIDVLGPDHHGYVPRLKAAMEALEYDVDRLEVVYLQHINLFEDGEMVKMSKRAGKIVSMDDLISEVGKDAARYFFLDRKTSAHLNFDLDLAKKKSSDNPVYYVQYAHARISSIQKKAKKQKITISKITNDTISRLTEPDELTIIKKLMALSDTLISVSESREPSRLCQYVHELAGMLHKYYAKHSIIIEDDPQLSQARLFLIVAVKQVLGISLGLMGIKAPDKM